MDFSEILREAGNASTNFDHKENINNIDCFLFIDEQKTYVLCKTKTGKDDEKQKGSCLICMAYKEHDIINHAAQCKKNLALPKMCSLCLVECTDSHLYSHTHATTLEKYKLIVSNLQCKVGITKAGALALEHRGANITKIVEVYDVKNRYQNVKKTSPAGLATYHLKSAILAASANNSDSKKLSENSAIVQTLLQVCLTCSAGHIPCVEAAKISYNVNGYSIVELVAALIQMYPKHYPYQYVEKACLLHGVKEKTVVFLDSVASYNHTISLLRILTGRNISPVVPSGPENDPKRPRNN